MLFYRPLKNLLNIKNLPYHKHLRITNFNEKNKQMTKTEIMKYERKGCKNKVRSKELNKEHK